jgi:hypothetical protein
LPVDRAREVARTCWEALRNVDPKTADLIAKAAAAAGEQWLAPEIAQHTLDDVVPVIDAAQLVGRSARWVYQWVAKDRDRRAVIGRDLRIKVRVRDVMEAVAAEPRSVPASTDGTRTPVSPAAAQEHLARVFDSLGEHDLAAKQREIAESLFEGRAERRADPPAKH